VVHTQLVPMADREDHPRRDGDRFPSVLHQRPLNIVAGPDGNLWFAEDGLVEGGAGAIGRITPSGKVTEFVLPTPAGFNSGAFDIAAGPDGNLWFTWSEQVATEVDPFTIRIGRITTSGAISSFLVATDATNRAFGIATGPDGGLWFPEGWVDRIGRMSTSGSLTEFTVPTAHSGPFDIATGRDSTLWFSEAGAAAIGRISLKPFRATLVRGRPE
jgi:streptogramin lyase